MRSLWAALLMVSGACPLAAQCRLEIATVGDLKGVWTDTTRKHRLVSKDVICGESIVERTNSPGASNEDSLTLLTRDSPPLRLTFQCGKLLGCEKPLDLSSVTREQQRRLSPSGFFESFAQYRNSGQDYAHTLTRGAQQGLAMLLKTAVVIAGRPIPLAEVFRAWAPSGTYLLDICSRPTDGECGRILPAPSPFEWRQDGQNAASLPPVPRGVNILYRVEPANARRRTDDRALIIGVDAADAGLIAEVNDKIAIAAMSISADDPNQIQVLEGYVRKLAANFVRH